MNQAQWSTVWTQKGVDYRWSLADLKSIMLWDGSLASIPTWHLWVPGDLNSSLHTVQQIRYPLSHFLNLNRS